MVLLDGKKISEKILAEIREELKKTKKKLRLAIVVAGKDPVIEKFIAQKKRAAAVVGIGVRIYPFKKEITTNELRNKIAKIMHEKNNTGVIIQLPLPEHINTQSILNAVSPEKDVDVLSARALGNVVVGKNPVISPVSAAAKILLEKYNISYKDKHIVVLGSGNLVGRPVALWLMSEHVTFSVVNKETKNPEEILKEADIIISGVGWPKLVKGSMVKDGVVILDAGTSESEGKLTGDVDFGSVAPAAAFITPVPGGIGPLTVALLLKNLITLAKK